MKTLKVIGEELSAIINQDGEDATDGEVVDQVIAYLKGISIYVEKE